MIPTGYIAWHRSVFFNPLLCDGKPFSRRDAWAYLVMDSAWRTEHRRVDRATVILERGQTAASLRGLAKAWNWHAAKVQRFIAALKRDGMIRTMAPDVIADAGSDALRRPPATIITICNYSKFNDLDKAEKNLSTQHPIHKPMRGEQQGLDLGDEFSAEPTNHRTKDRGTVEKKESGEKHRGPPRHGMVSKKHGTKFIERTSWEWDRYAEEYKKQHNGAEPIPDRHHGFWFKVVGNGAGRRRLA